MKKILLILFGLILTSCATIINDANVPVSLSFSDGSDGECQLSNKRFTLSVKIPSQTMIRRSDDSLRFNCETVNGKKGFGINANFRRIENMTFYSQRSANGNNY